MKSSDNGRKIIFTRRIPKKQNKSILLNTSMKKRIPDLVLFLS